MVIAHLATSQSQHEEITNATIEPYETSGFRSAQRQALKSLDQVGPVHVVDELRDHIIPVRNRPMPSPRTNSRIQSSPPTKIPNSLRYPR
jgi:hypothetical protein